MWARTHTSATRSKRLIRRRRAEPTPSISIKSVYPRPRPLTPLPHLAKIAEQIWKP